MFEPVSFRGVASTARTEYEVRRSRFVVSATCAATEEAAKGFIEQVSSEFRTASHNVYAYRVGLRVPVDRFSDDGEPSGTAGRPALEVLKQRKLLNVALVVTRYFGGTKLGAGGLVRAYSRSASMGIKAAAEVNWVAYRQLLVTVDYANQGKLEYLIRQSQSPLVDITYTTEVTIEFRARYDTLQQWYDNLRELTAGTAEVFRGQWMYLAENDDGKVLSADPVLPPDL